jgi:hypothetical protein
MSRSSRSGRLDPDITQIDCLAGQCGEFLADLKAVRTFDESIGRARDQDGERDAAVRVGRERIFVVVRATCFRPASSAARRPAFSFAGVSTEPGVTTILMFARG